ncbi:hypothetical protein V6N13_028372 [Hibiscus sabdariffa]
MASKTHIECHADILESHQVRYSSRLWKGLGLIWNDVRDNLVWNVSNGRLVDFWYDAWIPELGPLVNHLVSNRFVPDKVVVASMVNAHGEWIWDQFRHWLSIHVLLHIVASKCPSPMYPEDSLGWGQRPDRQFSTFLWLACSGRLKTNIERTRCHFTTDERCPACNVHAEENHVLRLCPVARLTWTVLVRPEHMHAFLSCPFRDWLSLNLSKDGGFARNTSAPRLGPSAAPVHPPESCLWSPPPMGWVKLNSDGASSLIDGNAACGGVLRDYHSAWVRGFSKFVGRCLALEAELWGISTRLKIAWDMGFRQLVVETDSMDAIAVL